MYTLVERHRPMTTRKLLPARTIYGYVRVSTAGQNPERQVHSIHEYVREHYGADVYESLTLDGADFVTVDKISGTTAAEDRDGLSSILDRIQPHDVLITPQIERLGRDTKHVSELRRTLEERQVIVIYSDEMDILSTLPTDSGRYPSQDELDRNPTHKLVSGIIIDLLTRIAAYERENSRKRQRQGIERAKERGVYKKPKAITSDQLEQIRADIAAGIPKAEVARRYKVSRATLHRYLKGEMTPDE